MEEDRRSQGGDTAWPIPRVGERPQDTAELPSALNLRAQREFPETRAPLRQAFAGPPSGPFPSPGSIIKPGPPGPATALEPSEAPWRPALRQPASPLQPPGLGPGLRPPMPPWFATCCSQLAFFFSTQKVLLSGQNSSPTAVISDSLGELDSEMKGNLQA